MATIAALAVATVSPGLAAVGRLGVANAAPGQAPASEAADPVAVLTHLRTLVEEIGPRPPGSAGEAAARRYVAGRLAELGWAVRSLPVTRRKEAGEPPLEIVIGSANLLASLPGTVDDAVLFTAHLDSRNAAVPGANDNAGGVAALLEAARMLSRSPPRLTVLLLFTCAEEAGLQGARHFVEVGDLDGLRAAVALDPVGYGPVSVAPFPAPPPAWALRDAAAADPGGAFAAIPAWLLAARVLRLPFAADHQPFLERGVPAFALSDRLQAWNYHHPLDDLEVVDAADVAAVAELVVGLVRRWDRRGIVADPDRDHVVVPLPAPVAPLLGSTLVVPGWGVRSIVLSLVLLLVARVLAWRRRPARGPRRAWTGLAWALSHSAVWSLVLVAAAALPALALGWLRGWRFAWWSHPTLHLLLALAAAAMAGWALAPMARWTRPPTGPGPWLRAALLLWLTLTALGAGSGGWSFALYPAIAALGTLAATWAPGRTLRCAAVALGLYPLLTLVDVTGVKELIALVGAPLDVWALPAVALVAWPVVATVAGAVAREATGRAAARGRAATLLGGGWTGAALAAGLAALAALATAAAATDSYRPDDRRAVRVRGEWAERDATTHVDVTSPEHLRGLTSAAAGGRLELAATETRWELPVPDGLVRARAWREPGGGVRYEVEAASPLTRARLVLTSGTGRPALGRVLHAAAGSRIAGEFAGDDLPIGPLWLDIEALIETDALGLHLVSPRHDAAIFYELRVRHRVAVDAPTPTAGTGRDTGHQRSVFE